MKSFVTNRSVSPSASGVFVPDGPSGAFQTPSTTAVVPLQWYETTRPDTCGNRPVLIAVLQTAEKPLTNDALTWAPVRVSTTVAFPKGSSANISPAVMTPSPSPADDEANGKSTRRPPEFVQAASASGYFARSASATMLPISDSALRFGSRVMSLAWVPT